MRRLLSFLIIFGLILNGWGFTQTKDDDAVISQSTEVRAGLKWKGSVLSFGEVVLEFPCPPEVEEPEGLAFGQGYLWFASQTQGIYQLDPSDGSVVFWIPMPMECDEIHGLAHDGNYLWAAAYDDNLYQIDPSNGSVISLIPAPGGGHIEGLAWNNNYLWLSRDDRKIYKIDPSSGAAIDFITAGSFDPEGLAYGDGFLWEGGFDNKISQIDPQTGSIISSFSGPGYDVGGLAWDGAYLWADSQIDKTIYKINVLPPTDEVWVDDDYCNGCLNGGHLWGYDAFDKIQDGIDAITSGGTVHVADGTYYENINFNGKAIVVVSESGPTKTIIHGPGIDNVVIGATGSTIQGFTITGSGDTWFDCGIQAYLATMTIRGNIITGNWLGIATSNYREPLIENNLIYNNIHYGIHASFYSAPTIINNTIAFNGEHGIDSNSGTGSVVNNIIFSNGYFGIFCSMPSSSPEIRYNDVYGNQRGNYLGCAPGDGDISADPLFIDAIDSDFHLSDNSPCIGAGIMTLDVPDTDIEGNPRPNPPYSYPDMGAYEHPRLVSLTITTTQGGTTRPKPGTHTYNAGAKAKIEAFHDEAYKFSHWSGDASGMDNPKKITMDSNKSIKANFIRQYTLTITSGPGGTTNPAPGTYTYDSGTDVTITATPENGYRFGGWTGDVSSTDNPITIAMNSNISIKAIFIRQYTLTLTSGPGGITQPSPGTYLYDEGTEVTISCIADTHCRFSHWSGDVSGTSDPLTIAMDSDKSITANFIQIIYAPQNFTGQKVLNRSLSQAEYINFLTWQANSNNVSIVKYRIYQVEGDTQSLLVELNANTFDYWHRRVEKDKQYTYALVAVNNEGREGNRAFITVQ